MSSFEILKNSIKEALEGALTKAKRSRQQKNEKMTRFYEDRVQYYNELLEKYEILSEQKKQ